MKGHRAHGGKDDRLGTLARRSPVEGHVFPRTMGDWWGIHVRAVLWFSLHFQKLGLAARRRQRGQGACAEEKKLRKLRRKGRGQPGTGSR